MDTISARERVKSRHTESAVEPTQTCEQIVEEDKPSDSRDHPLSNFSEQHDFLRKGTQYQWLLGKIHTTATLTQTDNDIIADINSKMNAAFNWVKHKGLYPHTPVCCVRFYVVLAMNSFLDVYYQDGAYRRLGTVITLTGSAIDAQAVTCEQYMRQTWPASGIDTLQAVERALINSSASLYKCEIHAPLVVTLCTDTDQANCMMEHSLNALSAIKLCSSSQPARINLLLR